MIHILISNSKKSLQDNGQWYVFHPMNDAILAICDTEKEADLVIDLLNTSPDILHNVVVFASAFKLTQVINKGNKE